MLEIKSGVRVGKLVVAKQLEGRLNGAIVWLCKCDCGAKAKVRGHHLRRGSQQSCGCGKGHSHNPAETSKRRAASIRASWQDPKIKAKRAFGISNARKGHQVDIEIRAKISASLTTHGMSKTRTYRCWSAMLDRCNNQRNKFYGDYGGRGIKVCRKWHNFEGFFEDMGEAPTGYELDRVDNNKGYNLKNCRWTTKIVNANNKRNNRHIEYQGKTQTLAQWARELGINYETLRWRFNQGWETSLVLSKDIIRDGRFGRK